MTFEPHDCWDCPVPYQSMLLLVVGGLAALLGAVLLIKAGSKWARVSGGVLLVLTALWYVGVSHGILRFGVLWGSREALFRLRPPDWPWSRTADLALLLGWYATSTLAVAIAIRRHRAVA
jgi:hypothetical protein